MQKLKRRTPRLTGTDIQYLFDGTEQFDNEIDFETIQDKWEKHKTEIIKTWFEDTDHLFKRPWSWWNWDHSKARRKILKLNGNVVMPGSLLDFGVPYQFEKYDHDSEPVFETQRSYLIRKNLLTEQEKTIIEI